MKLRFTRPTTDLCMPSDMIHPLWCLFGVLVTYLTSYLFFRAYPLQIEERFFITIYGLIAFYTCFAIITDKTKYISRKWEKVLPKALWKFAFWAFLLWSAIQLYSSHPFYERTFPNALVFVQHFFSVYLYLGFFYFLLSEKYRYSTANVLHDPLLRLLSLGKLLLRGRFRNALKRAKKEPYRNFLTACLLRVHFMPIMVEGLSAVNKRFFGQLQDPAQLLEPFTLVAFLTTIAWCVDNNNASVGYFWESNFTKTKFRKTDPNPLHWIITLSCYLPFNEFLSTFVQSPMHPPRTDLLLDSSHFQLATDIVIMFLALGYMVASTSLAFSWSNLSYKQIQTRGIYALVRHPGTLFKLGFFSVMIFRYKSAFNPGTIVAFAIWMGIYFSRTLCEERFLKTYPEYCAYMKQTKYRVIPGIF